MIDCPVCGSAMRVTPHASHARWTPEQLDVAKRLRGIGASKKVVVRVLQANITAAAIEEIEQRYGWRERRSA